MIAVLLAAWIDATPRQPAHGLDPQPLAVQIRGELVEARHQFAEATRRPADRFELQVSRDRMKKYQQHKLRLYELVGCHAPLMRRVDEVTRTYWGWSWVESSELAREVVE